MTRWSAAIEDRIRRTDYAGQLALDGGEIENVVLRPGADREPEVTDGMLVQAAEETGRDDLLPFDGEIDQLG